MMISNASVILWGSEIGAVSWIDTNDRAVFQYSAGFLKSRIELSPLMMPLREFPYEFPALSYDSFKGLPGLLADSLPDKFGNAVINTWLAGQGRTAGSFNPVERLCYTGSRGMGALEFEPSVRGVPGVSKKMEIEQLVYLANTVLDERSGLHGILSGSDDQEVIEDILRVGTSAGGARAKAILAWNPESGEFRSGQIEAGNGFEHWLMKFDGVSGNRDKELADPMGFGKIEYAYYLMAVEARIEMAPCRLHHEGGRSHFMTKRFDRTAGGQKLHMQTLGALAHYDYNQPGAYSYEQALLVMKQLRLPRRDLEQQVLRAFFNVIARNQDDHVKNIAFLMNRDGQWRLSPAYDVCYSWDPEGAWTGRYQMSLNGKRDNYETTDLLALAELAGIKKARARAMVESVKAAAGKWHGFASRSGVPEKRISEIFSAFRLHL